MKKILFPLAAALLAGCVSNECCTDFNPNDQVVGNWGLKFNKEGLSAGHMIAYRDRDGNPQAKVLLLWGSPDQVSDVKFEGNKFSFVHPHHYGVRLEGTVDFNRMTGTLYTTNGTVDATFVGWRNPPIPVAKTEDAVLGDPVDLLADGLDGWEPLEKEGKFGWKFENGVLSNVLGLDEKGEWVHGGVNLRTKRNDFMDFNLEYDVRVPKGSNSGVYLRGRYEIQVVDSYGKEDDRIHNMGAYYGRVAPSFPAEKPAGEWQHVNVTLYKRHLTVILNGVKIINNAKVVGITGGAVDADEFVPGFLYLQGDHSDADYRNMILRPCL